MPQINLKLHYKQGLYFQSQAKFTGFIGGVGSGKSFIGAHKALMMSQLFPKALIFIGANTHNQLTHTTLKTFFEILQNTGIEYVYNRMPPKSWNVKTKFEADHKGIITLRTGSQIWTKALTNYNDIRGQEIGYAWLDETRDTKFAALKVLMGRMRDQHGPRVIDFTTTPNGFDWLYDVLAGDKPYADSALIQCSSKDNADNLPDGYIEMMEDGYDERYAKQEIGGEFLNLSEGNCYYAFNRENNVSTDAQDDGRSDIIVGMDFNVSPMTATIGREYKNNIIWFNDITMNGSNTESLADEIIDTYPDWEQRGIMIYPDATGCGERSVSRGNYRSDHAILKSKFGNGSVHGARGNPTQKDRVTAVNVKLSKGMLLHPRMKKTISSLEKTKWMDGSKFKIDKKGNTEHWSDALGYPVFRLFPIKDTHKSGQASWMTA